MSKSKQILWILWLITCSASSVYFGYSGCAHAQEMQSQIVTDVKCPQTTLCEKNENGIWIPIWYARDLLSVRAHFEGVRRELESANEEIEQLRIADSERRQSEQALERTAAAEKQKAEIFENRSKTAEDKSNRRLKWLVGSSVVSVVVIAILTSVTVTQ